MRPVIDFPSRGMSTETVPLNRVRWTLLSITILRHVTVHTPSPALKRRSSLRKVTPYVKKKKKKKNRSGVLNVVPFTSSPSGVGVSFDSHIFCASAVWPGSSDGVTLTGYKSWRRSVAVKQRPPCLCVCVVWRGCTSCVYACARGRGGGAGPCVDNTADEWWL